MRVLFALVLAVGAPAAAAHGQGFGIHEHGTCTMSRGGAGVANPCDDGSAVYVNPAGLIGPEGIVIGGGGTLIVGDSSFTSDRGPLTHVDSRVAIPPHGYFRWGITDKLAAGVGLYAPYGLALDWPSSFEGRFVSFHSSLSTVYVQPSLAWAVNDAVRLGAGMTIARSSVELSRREDLGTVPVGIVPGLTFGAFFDGPRDFATTSLKASSDTGVGAHLGAIVRVTDGTHIGARYLTGMTLSYRGDAVFTPETSDFRVTQPNPLGIPVGTPLDAFAAAAQAALQDQSATTELAMPAQLVVGVSTSLGRRVTVLADYQWVDWSSFDVVTLDFANPIPPDERLEQGYRDTNGVRLGGDVQATRTIRVSAGYFQHQAAAPDENVTPLLPDAPRHHVTVGMGWKPQSQFALDVAYQFVGHSDRRGRVTSPAPGLPATTALNSGVYRSRGDLLGITMSYRF